MMFVGQEAFRFPANYSDSCKNFDFLPKQTSLELTLPQYPFIYSRILKIKDRL